MENQTFTDGIGRITVIGGIVRLDLVTYSPNETDPSGQPRAIFTQRIVMGADAFLRSSEKVLETVKLLTRGQAQPAPATARPTAQAQRPMAAEPPVPPQPGQPPAPPQPRRPFP
jgi:hypothetical protein